MKVALLALIGLLSVGCASTPMAPKAGPPTFIEDDAARAFDEAKVSGKPIFVDTWATWCHSCLALKAEVLTDPELARFSDHFVWLSLDVERESAAPFLARFPQPAYPTLWIIRPDGTPLLRWVGTLTAPQLAELLTDALVAHSGAPTSGAAKKLLEAEGLAAEGQTEAAIGAYRETLTMAPPDWSRRTRAANALLFILMKEGRNAEGLALALAETKLAQPGAAGRPDLVIGGIGCATELPENDVLRAPALRIFMPLAREIASDPAMLGDDRSGAWMAVVDAAKVIADEAAIAKAYSDWIDFLASAAAAAKTPDARAVFDTHRVFAYIGAKRAAEALAPLEQSERDFPNDYNPPARRALVLIELGRFDEALVANNRALALVYGPRRMRVRMSEATIYEKQGRPAAAREALQTALREAQTLPEAQRPTRLIAAIEKRLQALPE